MAPAPFTAAERPDLLDRLQPARRRPQPLLGRLYDTFREFQFVLYDEHEDVVLAEGHTIPCAWDGTPEGLPPGIDGMIEHGFRLRDDGAPVAIDRDQDLGLYFEPNLWMVHGVQ